MSKASKAIAATAGTTKLNKTPGGSFTRDPQTGKLTRVASTERTAAAAPNTKSQEK